jgi:hypothetical protein
MATTTTESPPTTGSLFNPLSGWEAASRWNAATFDMMARAWQQWIALMTVLPPHFVPERLAEGTSPQAATAPLQRVPQLRDNESLEPVVSARDAHAFAQDEGRAIRTSPRREARPSAKREPKRTSTSKPARGKAKPARARG